MSKNKNKINSLGIIMDGNRTWALENGLKKTDGHKEGLKTMLKTIDWVKEFEIKNVTFYAFSNENWNRSKIEVQMLLTLFEKVFTKEINKILEKEVSVKFVGSLEKFSKKLQKNMKDLEEKTKNFETKIFLAISYGGRVEVVEALKKIIKNKDKKEIQNFTEKDFEKYLQSREVPNPEIIIRTGGQKRLSGFLLWKSVYSELYFLDKKWPDFNKSDLEKVLEDYGKNTKVNNGK